MPFLLFFVVSALINGVAFLLLEHCIVWLRIPEQAVAYTREYLQIIFTGIMATCIYNFFAAILLQHRQHNHSSAVSCFIRRYQYRFRHCVYRFIPYGSSRCGMGYRNLSVSFCHLHCILFFPESSRAYVRKNVICAFKKF